MYYLHFSNYYRKLSHLFFHYSLNIFWILTTTRVWLTDIKIKIIEPYLKEHSKYLVFQIQDNVTLMQRRNITEPFNDDITVKPLTIPYMGHSQIIVPTSNWKITDPIQKTPLKYIYIILE